MAPTVGRVRSKVAIAAWPGGLLALADAGDACVELLLAADDQAAGDADVVEHDLGGVRGADAVLVELLALAENPGCRAG